jgi:rare lipoprotein A
MRRCIVWGLIVAMEVMFAATSTSRRVDARESSPAEIAAVQTGYATFVTRARDGGESASGEIFEGRHLVAAHRTLPWGSVVRVMNLENHRAVIVRVIDRGPYGANYRDGAIIDLSRAAATRLHMIQDGKVRVRLRVLHMGSNRRQHQRRPRRIREGADARRRA